nr:hypothetical protein [Mycoplasmopsis pulmonis]
MVNFDSSKKVDSTEDIAIKEVTLTLIKSKDKIVALNIKKFKAIFGIFNFRNYGVFTNELFKKLSSFLKANNIEINLEQSESFSISKVIKKIVHPRNEKLFILTFEKDNKQIITNQEQVKENDILVFANIGAFLPSGLVIEKNKIFDIESQGMLVSYKSLAIESKNTGLVFLNEDQKDKEFIF